MGTCQHRSVVLGLASEPVNLLLDATRCARGAWRSFIAGNQGTASTWTGMAMVSRASRILDPALLDGQFVKQLRTR